MKRNTVWVQKYASPCGNLLLGSFEDKLCLCDWDIDRPLNSVAHKIQHALNAIFDEGESDVIKSAMKQLDEYFIGVRKEFDIPLRFVGTPLQISVWEKLQEIPYGTTRTYLQMAEAMGRPNALRAVANSNATNAISIFVPCHRVIGSNGNLTGYSGGLKAKQFLLDLEKSNM